MLYNLIIGEHIKNLKTISSNLNFKMIERWERKWELSKGLLSYYH